MAWKWFLLLLKPLLICLATGMASLNEVLTETERVRDTPLPEAYVIAISQIAWVYILVLPLQLIGSLGWITIPGCIGEYLANEVVVHL
jgi:ion channel-forming bestrophin family protein